MDSNNSRQKYIKSPLLSRPIISSILSNNPTSIATNKPIENINEQYNPNVNLSQHPINYSDKTTNLNKLSQDNNFKNSSDKLLGYSQQQQLSNNINPPWFPRVLILGPGGAKGLKILGFLSPLEDSCLLDFVDTYCGVSVGSIIALLMICGYKIREIVGEAVKLDIFKEIAPVNLKSTIEYKGFISNEPVRKLLTQLVINKFGNVPTLHGLYMRTGKSFTAVTLNATDEACVMLNPFNNPDISCVDATMFSMNIPFIFYQLVYHGKTYVDGALANPYPIDYFDNNNTNILGIYIKTIYNNNMPLVSSSGTMLPKIDENYTQLPIGLYSLKIMHSLINQRINNIIQQSSSRCKHVCLETKIFDSFSGITASFGHVNSTEDKALLLVEGFNEGKLFLSQLSNDIYKGPSIPEKLKYNYPPYYIIEESNINQENIQILTEMNP